MAWSTRELAELAGTTVNTVRHYHRLGLLEQPERSGNGYKQYGARHLVRLLRIRRLVDLGVPLAQLDDVGGEGDGAAEVLRQLDAELAQQVERLQRARVEIAAILRDRIPLDVPPGFESLGERLSPADRSLLHIYTKLYDEAALADLRDMMESGEDAVSAAFDALTDDADDETRQAVAEGLAVEIAQHLDDYPWLVAQGSHLAHSETVTQQTFIAAAVELYNQAQREVLVQASRRAHELRNTRGDGA